MKTSPKKSIRGSSTGGESSMRLRESRSVEPAVPPQLGGGEDDEDMESELPIRGRPSKRLLLQQRNQYKVKLQPEIKTVAAATSAETSVRTKAKRCLNKKMASAGGNAQTQKSSTECTSTSYVMRLFERSLDLSKYKEKTPLYPVCRAWMANQPRNPNVAAYNLHGDLIKQENNAEEVLEKLRNGETKILKQMPLARTTELPIIPPRVPLTDEEKMEGQALTGASRSDLLKSNMKRWKNVRKHWLNHVEQYEQERYVIIDEILEMVCK